MFYEVDMEIKIAYIYSKDELIDTAHFSKEVADGVYIYKSYFDKEVVAISNEVCLEDELKKLKCKCGRKLEFTQMNRLPEEGWEELVDHWSCHNSEFSGMLKLKPKPRKNGLLYSHFYFLANKNDLCCFGEQEVTKIYYNEILSCGFKKLVFTFFKQYFENKMIFLFTANNVNYQVNFFTYTIVRENNEYFDAIKVGYKITNKIVQHSENVNEEVAIAILGILQQHSIGIKLAELELTFIY